MKPTRLIPHLVLLIAGLLHPLGAQVAYTGGEYAQDFDTLPGSGTFSLSGAGPFLLTDAPISASGLIGWSFVPGGTARFTVGTGSGNTGSVYSFGAASTTDRALGSLASGTAIPSYGVALVNQTGATISSFTLAYTGEQWRRGGSGNINTLAFSYSTDATAINSGTFLTAPALNFSSVNSVGTASALDGNAMENSAEISATISGITWAPGATLFLRWSDNDDGGSDDGLAIDDITFTTDAAAGPPAVVSTTPSDGAVNVATTTEIGITFSSPVNAGADAFAVTGSISGASSIFVSGGPTTFTLTPAVPFAEAETVNVTAFASEITDAATGLIHPEADASFSFTTLSTAPIPIHTVQGSDLTSSYAGQVVTVEGVVTATFQGSVGLSGFYVQSAPGTEDADPATSEGLFVFNNTFIVAVGDLVRVTGTVLEFGSAGVTETELSSVTAVTTLGAATLPEPVAVTLPFTTLDEAERYEGMRATLPQSLTVTDTGLLGRFGELVLSLGRLPTPTNIVAPGTPAITQEVANGLNQILVDDGVSTSYPTPTPYLEDSDGRGLTRRAGSTVTGLTGILDQKFGSYIIEPTEPIVFVDENPRSDPPDVGGSLKVAIGNVLNFFNGDGAGGGFPTSRGADSFAEYERQRTKIIAGVAALAPDIMGLTEIENDGFGSASAIADLVAGLNAAAPAGTTYAFIDASGVDMGTDEIAVALIFRVETAEPIGSPATLNNQYFNGLARPPLAQTFREIASGEVLTVCINHFKSKSSASSGDAATDGISPNPNLDQGDGQGMSNYLRTRQAQTLASWLATDPTASGDEDFLIIGDLNAYAQEDPITALRLAGYVNLTEDFEGSGGYSYSFDSSFGHLDHALASPHLYLQVTGAATWHANADEPVYYDYNLENKSATNQAVNVETPYRYSDHDPVLVGLSLTPDPSLPEFTAQPESTMVFLGETATFTVEVAGYPAPSIQWFKDGSLLEGATGLTLVIDSVALADAGSYHATATNSVGTATSEAATLSIKDTTPPEITRLSASPFLLWPANNKLVPVTLSAAVSDDIDPNPATRIIGVTANEAISASDWRITGDLTLELRASRNGRGIGRLYTVTVESTDAAGNSATKTVQVFVPKNALIALFYWLYVTLVG